MRNMFLPFNIKTGFVFFLLLFIGVHECTAQTTGDYRTKKSGLWTDSSIWETYRDSVWINATHPPTYQSNTITILNDTVTIKDTALYLDQVVIDSGLLYLKQNAVLHLKNGTGNDLVNNGTISIFNSVVDVKKGAVLLNDINGTFIFQTSDTITGSGRINNKNLFKTFTDILVPDSIVFNQTSGIIQGTGSISFADTLNVSGGDIKTAITILKGAVLNFNTSVSKAMASITNNGTVNWNKGDISFYAGAIFTNNGQFNIYEQGSLLNAEKTVATIVNATTGTIEKFATSQYNSTIVRLNITNLGSLLIHQGDLITYGNFHDSHVFLLAKSTLFQNDGQFYADPGEKITGAGIIDNIKSTSINYNDTLLKNLVFQNEGDLTGTGQLYIEGHIYLGGTCKIPVTIASTGTCKPLGINISAPFTNNGLVELSTGNFYIGAEFINNGELDIEDGFCTLTKGNSRARFINNGKMTSKYTYPSTFTINCTFINSKQGSLEGVGAFDFKDTLINEGSIDPGLTTPGSQIDFYYSPFQSSTTTNIRLGPNVRGHTKADNVFVNNGNTTLGGTLNLYATGVTTDTGYYTIVGNYGQRGDTTIIGQFSQINKPDNWDVIYTNLSVLVHVKAQAGSFQAGLSNQNAFSLSNESKPSKDLFIYPTPASSIVTIQFNAVEKGNYHVEVYDMSGKLLQYRKGIDNMGVNKIDLDVNHYSAGSYFIKVVIGGQSKILKFVKV